RRPRRRRAFHLLVEPRQLRLLLRRERLCRGEQRELAGAKELEPIASFLGPETLHLLGLEVAEVEESAPVLRALVGRPRGGALGVPERGCVRLVLLLLESLLRSRRRPREPS